MTMNPFKRKPSRKTLRAALVPSEKFAKETKDRFLAAFDAHYGTRPAVNPSHGMAGWAKVFITVGALAAVMVSVSAYADTANVAADSPLYPLKRLSETVQLALAPASDRAQIEVTLANRRVVEIQDLSSRKPSSTLLTGLSADFQNDVSSSLTHMTRSVLATATPTMASAMPLAAASSSVCGRVGSIFANSAAARLNMVNDPSLLQRFQDRCGQGVSTTITVMPSHSSSSNRLDLHVKSGIVAP